MDGGIEKRAGVAGRWLDRAAIALSGLCVVHCVATVLLAAAFATIGGGLLFDPHVHEIGLAVALLLAALGLGAGILRHGRLAPVLLGGAGLALMAAGLFVPHGPGEAIVSILGVTLVALAHHLNGRGAHRRRIADA
ncbi:MAG: MerC domain-containing protein [Sphingomonas fennica]